MSEEGRGFVEAGVDKVYFRLGSAGRVEALDLFAEMCDLVNGVLDVGGIGFRIGQV